MKSKANRFPPRHKGSTLVIYFRLFVILMSWILKIHYSKTFQVDWHEMLDIWYLKILQGYSKPWSYVGATIGDLGHWKKPENENWRHSFMTRLGSKLIYRRGSQVKKKSFGMFPCPPYRIIDNPLAIHIYISMQLKIHLQVFHISLALG